MFNAKLVIEEMEAIRKAAKRLDSQAAKIIRMVSVEQPQKRSKRQTISDRNATYLDQKFS